MKVCTNCGKKVGRNHHFCPICGGAVNEEPRLASAKGAKGRITVLVITIIISILATASSLTNEKFTLTHRIIEGIGGFGLILLVGDFFWGFAKWIRVVLPKSFAVANKVGVVMVFSPFSWFICLAIYLICLLVPCMVFGYSFIIIWKLALYGAHNPTNLLANGGMMLAGVTITAAVLYWDICALKGISPFRKENA